MFKWFRRKKEETAPQEPAAEQVEEQVEELVEEAPPAPEPEPEPPVSFAVEPAEVSVPSPEPPVRVERNREYAEPVAPEQPKPIMAQPAPAPEPPPPPPIPVAPLAEAEAVIEFSAEDLPVNPLVEAAVESEEGAPAAIPAEAPPEEKKRGFFTRLKDRLTKTKTALVEKVRSAIRLHGKVDEELLEEIEMILIQSDVGVGTTQKIVERMRVEARKQNAQTPEALLELFKKAIEDILHGNARPLATDAARPTIILMVGVNGTGKTTTIGKIAKQLADQGKRVVMVAADTFRAAAIEQLTIWAERTGSAIVRQEQGADPAAVVYEALEEARKDPPDVILIDTAGRLHTKLNLMEELKKIVRIIKKHYPEAPHETVLVLDATTGQNAVSQVKIFHEACQLSGLIMTKLDGTAKGGILIACKDLYDLPILKIGIGESAEDLRDFDPHEFVEALFSNGNGNDTE